MGQSRSDTKLPRRVCREKDMFSGRSGHRELFTTTVRRNVKKTYKTVKLSHGGSIRESDSPTKSWNRSGPTLILLSP